MTAQDQATALRIARIMRAARKRKGLTQQAVSTRLGISQGALSKMEHGLLIPSAPQWFEFCDLTSIPPESLKLGFLDRLEPVKLSNCRTDVGFKIPRQYGEHCGLKVRALLPLVRYFRKKAGDEAFESFCRQHKLDPDFFLDFDNQININAWLDLVRELKLRGHLKTDLSELIELALDPESHGRLQDRLLDLTGGAGSLRKVVESAPLYSCNFDYEVQEIDANRARMVVKPRPHLREFEYRNDATVGDFACQFKKQYFSRLPVLSGGKPAQVSESECHYHGADSCVYEFTWSK